MDSLAAVDPAPSFAPGRKAINLEGAANVCFGAHINLDIAPGPKAPITGKEIVPSGYGGGGNFVLKKATTAGLNSRWNAARSKPAGSRQISGAMLLAIGVQGARKAKWPALRTT